MDSIVEAFPAVAPYLALVPVAQVVAGLLANLPRAWGVTHETAWSRFFRTVASLPVLYHPKYGAPSALSPPRGFAAVRSLLFLAAVTAIVATGVRCAAVRRGVETVEGAPVKGACFTFEPPVRDSTGKRLCSQLCVSTDPPSAVWSCAEATP